jgi:hypothetical protein
MFAVALLSPGYLAANTFDLGGFRLRGQSEKLAWSVALSFGVGTLPIVALVWCFGGAVAGYVLLTLTVLALIFALRAGMKIAIDRRILLLGFAFVSMVILSLVDIGIGQHLWMSVTSYDHGIRTAFVDAVLHTGVVPTNPLYWPGHAAPMRYYYFWYVTCAVVAKLAHISARQALIASCVWPFAGVLATLALYARHLLGWQGSRLRRGWWVAIALLGVTGLDILATIGARLGGDPLYGDMDWWSIDQVSSWADSFLWVPHHVAALICCLMTLLLVRMATSGDRKLAVVAGLSFASAFGLSTYVALATALVLAMWLVWRVFHDDQMQSCITVAIAGSTATVLLLPYLSQLLHRSAGEAKVSHSVVGLAVRQIISPTALTDLSVMRAIHSAHPFVTTQLAALVLLIPGYVAELGFFLVVLLVMQFGRTFRETRSEGEETLLFWTWSGLVAATFLRSQVIATNDYGIRSMLLPQFLLLLIGVLVLQQSSGWFRKTLMTLAIIGAAGTVYQVVLLRVFLPWHESAHDQLELTLSKRNYALRDAYQAMGASIPAGARVQYDPDAGGYFGSSQLLNIHRQIVVDGTLCNASFGGDPAPCAAIQQGVARLYTGSSASDATAICSGLRIEYLVANRWDSVWAKQDSWVWSLPLIVDRPNVRIVQCAVSGAHSER